MKFLAFACLIGATFLGCLIDGESGYPNEVRGTIFYPNGQRAQYPTVTLYPMNYMPGSETAKTAAVPTPINGQANGQGDFSIKDVPDGEYNLVAGNGESYAFRSAISVHGRVPKLPPDTLRMVGKVTGTARLQPQIPPRKTVFVQIPGTDYQADADSNGRFTLTLPKGSYRLRAYSTLPEYEPLVFTVTVKSGMSDTLLAPFALTHANIPAVSGISAFPDSSGGILLVWKRPASAHIQTYLIYRDSVGAPVQSTMPYANTTDTVYHDILYTRNYTEGKFSHLDSAVHAFTYRVRVRDSSDNIGPVFGSVVGTPIPFTFKYHSGRWHRALASAPFGRLKNPSVVDFNNALWLFGGGSRAVWTSLDGITWQKALDSLPVPAGFTKVRATVLAGKMWLIAAGAREQDRLTQRGIILASANGTDWSVTKDSLPVNGDPGALFTFKDILYSVGGSAPWIGPATTWPVDPNPRTRASADGVNWNVGGFAYGLGKANPSSGGSIVTVFNGKLWVVGGGSYLSTPIYNRYALNASDLLFTSTFLPDLTPTQFLPRIEHSVVSHSGKLWSVGGRHREWNSDSTTSEVWVSETGKTWDIIDFNPFPPRDQPAVIPFNGRLWVIGGIQADGTNDIWYYE